MDTCEIVNMFSFSGRSLQGQEFFGDASVSLAAISQGCTLDLSYVHSEGTQVNAGIYKMVFYLIF